MQLIIGLGNPGKEYEETRHNIGFAAVDNIASKANKKFVLSKKLHSQLCRINSEVFLVKPETFMNASGRAVQAVAAYYGVTNFENIYVAHDDLDLVIGTKKIQLGTGPKIHNGLSSIYENLGTKDFWHVRLGIDGRAGDRLIPSKNYVLQPFAAAERPLIDKTISEVTKELVARTMPAGLLP
ncbi:MAG: aminoacyl-tRNA hydrolase [Candidatus Pacebacteria bacterium CG10_big_fil_rev_8_21_14_0_10_42_12]|nr:aminoacyl-tRNA hydrolase [Candidatus Paceibacterota bacterium]PIR62694.1 MAG: aminoacyl-tRNA hydrolase [Candidatus Pacebacteria bacterium CG10_big_fil_rev_8_21_14_0_10_42_12]